jgi:hypothetical protein
MLDWISSQGVGSGKVKGGDVGDNVDIASQL